MFNFWLVGLVDGLEPHLPPLCSQKIKCSFLDYVQLLMISQAGRWTRTPPATPLQPKKRNAHFWITFNFWWSAGWSMDSTPSTTPLQPKNKMLIFALRSTSDDQLGWSMDSNPICHPFQPKNKCSFLHYIQLLMIGRAGQWTWTLSATLSSQKIKCSFLEYVQLLMIGIGLVDGFKPCLPPLSSQKNKMLVFGLHSTSDDWLRLVDGLEPCLPPLSSQKNKMLIFGLHSTSDDRPGW